mmetsp:Transcript_25440/g.63820  ORF Transcript_25440/g.63820 Transcript_25440/m.63820 type:complete len:281 (-) Transcript_25440:3773-4615(-)
MAMELWVRLRKKNNKWSEAFSILLEENSKVDHLKKELVMKKPNALLLVDSDELLVHKSRFSDAKAFALAESHELDGDAKATTLLLPVDDLDSSTCYLAVTPKTDSSTKGGDDTAHMMATMPPPPVLAQPQKKRRFRAEFWNSEAGKRRRTENMPHEVGKGEKYKWCAFCSISKTERGEHSRMKGHKTVYYCKQCDVPLCNKIQRNGASNCFFLFHVGCKLQGMYPQTTDTNQTQTAGGAANTNMNTTAAAAVPTVAAAATAAAAAASTNTTTTTTTTKHT